MRRIESLNNPKVKEWQRLSGSKGRRETGLMLLEGPHLIEEARGAGVELIEVLLRDGTEAPAWMEEGRTTQVTPAVMKEICDATTPQGIAAVCKVPEFSTPELRGGQFLLVDAVQDPGNVGTLIRTADAAGLRGVFLGEGCADPLNPKALRASMGSIFHLPVLQTNLTQMLLELRQALVPVYGSSLTNAEPFNGAPPGGAFALIVGNEGAGVRSSLLADCDRVLTIPILGRAESLSVPVAAGILLYHLAGV